MSETPALSVPPRPDAPAGAAEATWPPLVALAGYQAEEAALVGSLLEGELELLATGGEAQLLDLLGRRPAAVLCLGAGFAGAEARRLLDRALETTGAAWPEHVPPVCLVLAAGPALEAFQDAVDRDQVFYLSRRPPEARDQAALLAGALRRHRSRSACRAERGGRSDEALDRLADPQVREILDRVALQSEAGDLAELLAAAARRATRAHRAACLLYDRSDDTLWTPEPDQGGERRESAAAGVASFVLRSGFPVRLARLGEDPRYDAAGDDPGGSGEESFAAAPIASPAGDVLGVLTAVRGAGGPAGGGTLGETEAEVLELLARLAAPHLARLAPGGEPGRPAPALPAAGAAGRVFRREALAAWSDPADELGEALELQPVWIRWSSWVLAAGLLAALLALLSGLHRLLGGGGG